MVETDTGSRTTKASGRPEASPPSSPGTPEARPEEGAAREDEAGTPQKGPGEASPEPDWKTRYLYLLADFDNFRKRSERDLRLAADRARASLLLKVIRLFDGLERAFESLPPEERGVRQGLGSLLQSFTALLSEEQVRPVAREGEPFRAEDHEAVGELPASSSHPVGSVASVVQQGYRAPYGLLRAAKVLVAQEAPRPSSHPSELAEGAEKAQEPSQTPPEEDP